jgi:AAA ATPase containing von Willebrand factor type A (vWA) domain
MCNMFFSRPTCLSRTAMTPGLTQICLLEENSVARMAYHTNVQVCPKLLSFEHINNDPQQFGNLHFQYKIQPVMSHFACDVRLLTNKLNLSIMEPRFSKLLIQNFTSESNLCHLNPNHMTIN